MLVQLPLFHQWCIQEGFVGWNPSPFPDKFLKLPGENETLCLDSHFSPEPSLLKKKTHGFSVVDWHTCQCRLFISIPHQSRGLNRFTKTNVFFLFHYFPSSLYVAYSNTKIYIHGPNAMKTFLLLFVVNLLTSRTSSVSLRNIKKIIVEINKYCKVMLNKKLFAFSWPTILEVSTFCR